MYIVNKRNKDALSKAYEHRLMILVVRVQKTAQ